jgi:hypothetical protein
MFDGIQFYSSTADRLKDTAKFLCTGSGISDEELNWDFVTVVQKPYRFEELARIVAEGIEEIRRV